MEISDVFFTFWAAAPKGAMSYRIGRFVRLSVRPSVRPYVRLSRPSLWPGLTEALGALGQASRPPSQALEAISQASGASLWLSWVP